MPPAMAKWNPVCNQAMGASLGPGHTRGPFCPCPSTAGSGQNTASLFAPTGPAPAWPGVNCPAAACPPRSSAGSSSPLPNTGGLCGATGLNGGSVRPGMPRGGREAEPLVSSVYLEVEIMARPSCRSGGTFMPALTGWGVPCCTRPRAACSMTTTGAQQGLGRASLPPSACTVLNPPARCSWRPRARGGTWE